MFPIPSPIIIYAAGAAVLAAGIAGYKVRDWQCDAAYAKALEEAQERATEMQEVLDERSRDFEAARDQVNVLASRSGQTIREIYRQIPAPAASCAAPDNIVRLLESSINTANAATSSKPIDTLQTSGQPTDSSGRPRKSDVGKHDDSQIHGMQRETQADDTIVE